MSVHFKTAGICAALALLAAAPAQAAPGDMSIGAFLAKVTALKAKGAMALFSPDVKVLKSEGQAAGQAYAARLKAEKAAGKPSSCPPKNTKMGSGQFISHLESYPHADRGRVSLKTAIADYFIRTYPCK